MRALRWIKKETKIGQPEKDTEGGMPVVRPTDIKKKKITLDGLKRIDQAGAGEIQQSFFAYRNR